jgi:hypothetical protein
MKYKLPAVVAVFALTATAAVASQTSPDPNHPTDPHSTTNPHHTTTDPHHTTTDPHHTPTDPHSTTDPHHMTTDPHNMATDPHHTTTNSEHSANPHSASDPRQAQKSQGPAHASPVGVAHANENSVLASGSVAAATLPGLNTGLTVKSSSGTSLGTISRVITGPDGSIRLIEVTSPGGATLRFPANSLSISGGVVTTTSVTPTP